MEVYKLKSTDEPLLLVDKGDEFNYMIKTIKGIENARFKSLSTFRKLDGSFVALCDSDVYKYSEAED